MSLLRDLLKKCDTYSQKLAYHMDHGIQEWTN